MPLTIPGQVQDTVHAIFHALGVPDYIWQSIAAMETGGTFDPAAKNVNVPGQPGYNPDKPTESSWGLFQLNVLGGQGSAYAQTPEKLLNPELNALVASSAIAKAYQEGRVKGLGEGPDMAAYVAANSGHPGYNMDLMDPRVQAVKGYAKMILGGEPPTDPLISGPGIQPQPGLERTDPPETQGGGVTGLVARINKAWDDFKSNSKRFLAFVALFILGILVIGVALYGMINRPTVIKEGNSSEA